MNSNLRDMLTIITLDPEECTNYEQNLRDVGNSEESTAQVPLEYTSGNYPGRLMCFDRLVISLKIYSVCLMLQRLKCRFISGSVS